MQLRIIRIKSEDRQVKSLILKKPTGFTFYPGQYLDISLQKNTRAFSISTSPTEDFLMITTKKGISLFKKHLFSLKPGNLIKSSHPAGTFILDEMSPAVFIAGGIGITPFRSMVKYAVDNKLKTPITLIFSNSNENFLFKDELDLWQKSLPKLKIIYHNSIEKGRLTKLYPIPYTLYPIYYLAGSHSFVNAMEKILLEMGIDQTNIRYDRFDGYH